MEKQVNTIELLNEKLVKGEISSVELTKKYLENIGSKDKDIKAYITVCEKEALDLAKEADNELKKGESKNPLLGIPCAIKDVIVTEGIRSTASSNILKNYISPYDATVVTLLKKAGAVILGKTNCDAFAHGASTENSDFFATKNPIDPERVPGGSSGGSAAAVASDQAVYALGSDTGGSIRQPASFCGLVGLKPTYGLVSRYGLMSMTSSTDCIGPITKTVKDAALVLSEIAGGDSKDANTSMDMIGDFAKNIDGLRGKLKIGVVKEYNEAKGIEPGVKENFDRAVGVFRSLGHEIVEVSLPHVPYAVAVYYIVTPSEVSANLARYDGIRFGYSAFTDKKISKEVNELFEVYSKSRKYGFGNEAKRRVMLGTYALSAGYYDAFYLKASKVRTLIIQDFEKAFDEVDVLISPTSPKVAFKLGEQVQDPLQMYLEDIFLAAQSLAGVPAISIPCGKTKPKDGKIEMPVGLQIIGPQFNDAKVLQVAYQFEQNS